MRLYTGTLLTLSYISTSFAFAPARTSQIRTLCQLHESKRGFTFQYSPSSLKHLEAVELPPDYSIKWSKEKAIAISGAFALGGISAVVGMNVAQAVFGDNQAGLLLGAAGTILGWYLFGGEQVAESERPMNGGYDAKLTADRPKRLQAVLDDLAQYGISAAQSSPSRDLATAVECIEKVHGQEYMNLLQSRCQETDRPVRFNPLYARTLIDENTYDAAVNSVQDWLDSVDAALSNSGPKFALSRPPGHHACKSKGMGGCLFNSAAIAAFYALSKEGVDNVAILDFDAHHGNGIAHCVQEEARIRYCSIHEDKEGDGAWIEKKVPEDDPRSGRPDDTGPLNNLLNCNLKAGTGWDNGYQETLTGMALPFLLENNPDLLIVSAGFDSLASDWSSQLQLNPRDFHKLGAELKSLFGNKVAMGLEGGYSFQDGSLSKALIEFSKAWQE